MGMPDVLPIKITTVLLCALLLFAPMMATGLTACSNVSAEPPSVAHVDPAAYAYPGPSGVGILNPDAEVRGIWIASVLNINFPSKPGLSSAKLALELNAIVQTCIKNNFNTIYFQVRPAADALYNSSLFPTSRYLTAEQGDQLPDGFDPLQYLLTLAHANNIRVHAWVNPLRVTAGNVTAPETDVNALAPNHVARLFPGWAIPYADGKLYFDAGIPDVRAFIAAGVEEIVRNYDVDGVIFDDYFYPYPVNETANGKKTPVPFDDDATFAQYGGGFESREDWRRDNINQLIEDCYRTVKATDPECLFGVAPFGIWQNDDGENGGSATSGLSSYNDIYCDPLAWIKGGYLDYIAPQIYWRFATNTAPYDVLVRWWNAQLDGTGIDLLISHGVYQYATWDNPSGEISQQIEFARSELAYRGSIHYGYAAIADNTNGLADELRSTYAHEIIYSDVVSNGHDLAVTSPPDGSYVDAEFTYLIGSSDPTKSLRFEGGPVSRTKNGYFSLYVPLEEGENVFTFLYDGKRITHTVHRGKAPTGGSSSAAVRDLGSFTVLDVIPSESISSGAGSTVTVSCTAPAASTVTATLGEQTVTLTAQNHPTGKGAYLAETYVGKFTLPATPDGTLRTLGHITVTAKKGNETATAIGADVRAMGRNAVIPIEVKSSTAELKLSYTSWYYDDFTPQAGGMRDYAVSQANGYYLLRVGGFIRERDVHELSPSTKIDIAEIKSISVDRKDKHTVITVDTGGVPIPMNGYVENGIFYLSLYNVNADWKGSIVLADNPLFSSATWAKSTKANSIKLALTLCDIDNFYGFDLGYSLDGSAQAKLRNPAALTPGETPLSGKLIVLDAGHGGSDSGAVGAHKGLFPADEADLNLAIALAAARELRELGADVILTRVGDYALSLDARVALLDRLAPDLSISIHQNSMPYSADITRIRGLVGLYFADAGRLLTKSVSATVASSLGRLEREPAEQRLALCRNARFPSTLVEVGFITCVEEYEQMLGAATVSRTGEAIAQGVLEYYLAQAKWIK